MGLKIKNDAVSRIASGISSTDTTITLVPGSGTLFPVLSSGDYFPATLIKSDGSREIVRVTARSSDVFTVVRAQEGTVALTFNANDRIELRMTAGTYTDPSGPSAVSITSASAKETPADADLFGITDSADVFKLKKFSWANLKTAIKSTVLNYAYPVGSIYINASSVDNPATLLGIGTWEEIGAGRVLVGQNTSDTLFDALGETGGSKDAIVVAHSHTGSTGAAGAHNHSVNDPGHSHQQQTIRENSGGRVTDHSGSDTWEGYAFRGDYTAGSGTGISINGVGDHTHSVTVGNTGSSGTNANLPSYLVVKMWKRVS